MKTILFQGDSITDCGRLRPTNNSFVKFYNKLKKKTPLGPGYPALVADELKGGYSFVNRGVGGDKAADVYSRIVADIINVKPGVMSLLVGVNDVWREFDQNCGTGLERFKKIYTILIEEILEELPETKRRERS